MFVSFFFLFFLGIMCLCFFCLPSKWRVTVLLVGSYVFCAILSVRALWVLIIVSLAVWRTGIAIERIQADEKSGKNHSKRLLCTVIAILILLLCSYKYIPYGLEQLESDHILKESLLMKIAMPIGFSFYFFQAISYLVDVYQKKYPAEKRYDYLGVYFAFFAKFTSGPIERGEDFFVQLDRLEQVKFWNRGRLSIAFTYMLWGYFLKMVIADRLALKVDVFFSGVEVFDSLWLFLGVIFYSVQIYSDFAGYSYIALGCAKIFGIHLTHNFEMPYMATNIAEFWRRWHISLSSWLRDYIYIPLGGNRKGIFRKCINTMIVFVICGMWHGSGANYIIWGILHGCYLVIYNLWLRIKKSRKELDNRYLKSISVAVGRVLTLAAVAIAWIFFRESEISQGILYIKEMFTSGITLSQYKLWINEYRISLLELGISFIGIATLGLIEWYCYFRKEHLPEWIQHGENIKRYAFFYIVIIIIFIFGIYGPGYHVEEFIYMQF